MRIYEASYCYRSQYYFEISLKLIQNIQILLGLTHDCIEDDENEVEKELI